MELKIVSRPIENWGNTYGPPGDGPFPAIMILHGSDGRWSGWSHRQGVFFAAHGFVAFPFGYSKGGNFWDAGNIIDVPLDKTAEALLALRQFPVAAKKIGLYGVSRGAEHALLLTSLMARDGVEGIPDAVAAHSPSDVICAGFDSHAFRDRGDPGWQPRDPGLRAWTWRGSSDDLLPTAPIEIEHFDGPVFLSHGTKDSVWTVEMTRRLEERLHRHGGAPEVHFYEGQDHGLWGAAENMHNEHLIAFFERHLAS